MTEQQETTPYAIPLVTEMSSDELVAFVERRQEERLKIQLASHKRRSSDAEIKPEVISARLKKEEDKLQKALDGAEKHEEKVRKALNGVVALRSQLGLES